jgi:transposase-like protein
LAGFRFPPEVIVLAVRWYLRYGLSYRDVEELLAERGITVDHVTIYRWVQRFTPELIDAARPSRHVAGDRWFVDETYLKLAGQWVYLYRAIDQHGQVIDVLASPKRDLAATRRFFARALNAARRPTEVTTDRAPAYPRVLDELVLEAWHVVSNTPTIRSKPITVSSNTGSNRCAGYRPTGPPRSSSPGTRSCRTFDADTTNSGSTSQPTNELPPRSPNSLQRSDQTQARAQRVTQSDNATRRLYAVLA